MDEEIRRLRADARRLAQGKHRSQVRYPHAFRRVAVTVARRHQRRGDSLARLAHEIGVSEPTLTKWLGPRPRPGLRPVAVTMARPLDRDGGANPVLITSHGLRVEGLDCDTLIAVLRALA